jgi:hypothetical protein
MNYQEIKSYIKESGFNLPANGTDNEGNPIIVSEGSVDGNHYYRVDTAQNNGWVRVNCYYADGQQDETFERGDEK